MTEKIIIKSEHYNLKAYIRIILLITVSLISISVLSVVSQIYDRGVYQGKYVGDSLIAILLSPFSSLNGLILLILSVIFLLLILIIKWWLSSYELTITDKRIFGKTSFGKRIDLPVDSVSVVGTSMLKGITIATSSGKIDFKLIKNRDEIHSEISNLIISRQSTNSVFKSVKYANDVTSELKKYKELLDENIITQEDFDTKKKELLNL